MKRGWIILLAVFLMACTNVYENQTISLNQTSPTATEIIKNENPKANCPNECMKDGCIDNDYYQCVIREDGCNYFVKVGPTKGKCNMDCFNDYDCPYYQDCTENKTALSVSYKCINVSSVMAQTRYDLMQKGLTYR